MHANVTILLQGRISPDVDLASLLLKYANVAPVVLSVYDYQLDILKQLPENLPTYKVVVNNQNEYEKELIQRGIPEITTTDECHKCFFQISSIQNALQYITTEYVLFCRIDHLYGNIEKVIEEGIEKQKFVIPSLVVRGTFRKHWRYHFSDCMIFGKTEKMKKLFSLAKENYTLENITYRPNECRIWRNYFIHSIMEDGLPFHEHLSDSDYVSYVEKHLVILPVHDLAPFRIISSNQVKTEGSYSLERKTTAEYLIQGVQCMGY